MDLGANILIDAVDATSSESKAKQMEARWINHYISLGNLLVNTKFPIVESVEVRASMLSIAKVREFAKTNNVSEYVALNIMIAAYTG